ncbi:MAG: helix-turn-helix protein [Firmicutes bacterium]|nr:helix-turn-helix protein [Bacillota bacterium]
MGKINQEVGKKIRNFRKKRKMTVQNLADHIQKSKATVSKYETGEISIDLVTLYAVADALKIHVEQLLYIEPYAEIYSGSSEPSAFFKNSSRFYSYIYDGRNNSLMRCVIDIFPQADQPKFKTVLYMNVKNYKNYEDCENTYWGYTEHYDVLTTMTLINQATPVEKIMINILASFMDADKKWGLMASVSFRPFMPVASKMLFSKTPLAETQELIDELKISKEDIRIMKMYNMMAIT